MNRAPSARGLSSDRTAFRASGLWWPVSSRAFELRAGTCGWSYPDWVGPFYPPGTSSQKMLERYARVFDTVEVNSSFYAVPPMERTRRWARSTPEGFDFALKAPSALTHEARLDIEMGHAAISDFVGALSPLGAKLGFVLLQLPPSLHAEEGFERLQDLLEAEAIPAPLALEARHPSWDDPRVYELLEAFDVTWVWSENDAWTTTPKLTTSRVYLRLMGDRKLDTFDRIQRDREPTIRRWQARLEENKSQLDEARVYASNYFAGFGPGTVNAVLRIAGQEPRRWSSKEQGGQATLGEFEDGE